ncbi:hypothetical protein NLC26_03455 [Candidatus Aminicenantes bacterium AC-708-M15]|jgi:hypothetical protein|nr:hypothetical protein [SCandidatus Aminicenantes bacterium Aminicenantia_JdfR_composite]MCP2597537.1 hypothetical protein [Candidatus Aminicenantes bacterium AC-335-G13]MCP2598746.1 hypothetical protein [Candidatus Aminicenantes bacterium AC-335-L06]MCP2604520.1 hypothetical protein [Candidatus Aminicenantes bacterium AC-708-M15]MCP2618971.1 hypothetical protein [Candidatus Aminicenantes bacterium AC-335-A11]
MKKQKVFIVFVLILWSLLVIKCRDENNGLYSNNKLPTYNFPQNLLSQRIKERKLSSNTLRLVAEIDLEKLKVYNPAYLKFDIRGSLYTIDFSEFLIHKFSPAPDWKNYKYMFFGKGKGQGPGELSQVLDFKIFKNELFLVDEGTGSIEVYSTDGSYIKRINLSNNVIPRKITIQKNRLIVESSLIPEKPLFYIYDFSGNMISSFGELISEKNLNPVYLDNKLSESFYRNRFYYLPRFLGYIALYEGRHLLMVKETIDGIKKGRLNTPVEKVIMKNIIAKTVIKKYATVVNYALHKDFILIKAYDYKNKIVFWDIYELNNFDYLMSIKNPPKSVEFAIYKDYIAVLGYTETGSKIEIFDMREILKEIKQLLTHRKSKEQYKN